MFMSTDIFSSVIRQTRQKQGEYLRCGWPNCQEKGSYRAPKSRSELKSFHWFCKKHAREYNLAWNYYDGMTDEEVEEDLRKDITWQRPSWKLGSTLRPNSSINKTNCNDPFGFFSEKIACEDDKISIDDLSCFDEIQKKAVGVLGLDFPISIATTKAKYKELVKVYHPDANANFGAHNKTDLDENE